MLSIDKNGAKIIFYLQHSISRSLYSKRLLHYQRINKMSSYIPAERAVWTGGNDGYFYPIVERFATFEISLFQMD